MPEERQSSGVYAADNPLRSEQIEQIPIRFETGDWSENLQRLARLDFRAAVVGKKGSGKTCLLEQLCDRLVGQVGVAAQLFNLPLDKRQHAEQLDRVLAASGRGEIVLLDGIERLSFWQRNRVFRETLAGPGLVVAVHRKCRLPTWIRLRTSLALMRQLIDDLGIATPTVLSAGEIAFDLAGGNIREAFGLLYDQFADGRLFLAASENRSRDSGQ
jgi:hypothetical protein